MHFFLDSPTNKLKDNDDIVTDNMNTEPVMGYDHTLLSYGVVRPSATSYHSRDYTRERNSSGINRIKPNKLYIPKLDENHFSLNDSLIGGSDDENRESKDIPDERENINITTPSMSSDVGSILSTFREPISEWWMSRFNAMKDVFSLAWPIFITSELLSIIYFINIVFIGHNCDADALSGVVSIFVFEPLNGILNVIIGAGLGSTMINILGQAFIIGMSSCLSTLCGQAWGAKVYDMLGIYLQRSVALTHIVVVLIGFLFWYLGDLLTLIGMDKNVSKNAGIFSKVFIIALWPLGMWYNLRRYLQSQRQVKIIFPTVICGIIGQFIGIYLFYYKSNTIDDYTGILLAIPLAYWLQFGVLIILIGIFRNKFKQTFPGVICSQIFVGWKQLLSISIPSLLMLWYDLIFIYH